MKKLFQALGTILLIGLVVISIPFTIPRFLGYSIFEVISDSMSPEYPVESVIYVKDANPDEITVGDVITFSLGTDTTQVMTHRVVAIDTDNGLFTTKGDANEQADVSPVSFQRLIGKPVYKLSHMGKVVSLFETTQGRVLLACLVGLVFILWFSADHLDSADEQISKEKIKDKLNRSTTIIFVVGIAMILFAIWNMYRISKDYRDSNDLYEQLKQEYVKVPVQDVPEWYQMAEIDLPSLQKQNPDVAGWLLFENEDISYPLMYSGDDTTYLHTALDGSSATAGSIFIEGGNHPDMEDSHTIIYGHNMRNLSMFGKLRYYKQEDYYKDHAYFQIITNAGVYRYQIFACEEISADSFIYHVPYAADETFEQFIAKLYRLSYYDTGVVATKEDKIVTLSTCSRSGMRFVVHGVRIDSYCDDTKKEE